MFRSVSVGITSAFYLRFYFLFIRVFLFAVPDTTRRVAASTTPKLCLGLGGWNR
jgi:hypothetical protein